MSRIKDLFYNLQNQMVASLATNRSSITHPGALGVASELNWIEWLKQYLPKRYFVDKAFVVDCNDNISQQIDVVIYDQQYTPFVFKQNSVIYVPAESVYAVFEVKQELTKDYLEYAGDKAQSVRSLDRTSAPIPHAGGYYDPKEPGRILAGILTLSSSWKDPLGKIFEENVANLTGNRKLDLGCCLKHGSFRVEHSNDGVSIHKSTPDEAFIYFFLTLLMELQELATVSAIDISCYAKSLDSF